MRYRQCHTAPSSTDNPDCYRLQLADGQGWEIIAAPGAQRWVRKLASIMQLEPTELNGYPKLFFIRKGIDRKWWQDRLSRGAHSVAGHLPKDGWVARGLRSLQVWVHDNVPDVLCEMGDEQDHDLEIVRMWLAFEPIYNRVLELRGLPLHAALVERNGQAFLLAAPGGTGKSTCCDRIPAPWNPLSDDLALVVFDQHEQRYRVHPFPTWSNYLWKRKDTTWNVQQHFPLSGIFFVEQGQSDEAVKIGQGQASVLLTESAEQICRATWINLLPDTERQLKEKLFRNTCAMSKKIPAFKLRATLQGKFWEEMEKVLL